MSSSKCGESEEYYLAQIDKILYKGKDVVNDSTPTKLSHHVYIGDYRDAKNAPYRKSLGITHVLNMAAHIQAVDSPYSKDSGIKGYKPIHADDNEAYPIMKHFDECRRFIDSVKRVGGKILIHCAMGINRSGAICIAYLMVDEKKDLLEALRHVKEKRNILLCNTGFQKQLIKFAREKRLLPRRTDL